MAATEEENFNALLGSMSLLSYDVGSQFYAKPTYIIDPHNFFLMPFPFREHLNSLSTAGKHVKMEELKLHMTVIFTSKLPDLNMYFKLKVDKDVRGTILKIDKEKNCQIYALDYGFIEDKVPIERIFHPLHRKASNIPGLCQLCSLDMCAPRGPNFSADAIEAFKFYIGNEKLSVVVKGKDAQSLKVVVYNSNPDDVATLLALTHYTLLTPEIPHDLNAMTVRRTESPKLVFEHLVLQTGEKLTVRVQSGSSLNSFFVSPMVTYKRYIQNRGDFTDYCKNSPAITPEAFAPKTLVGVPDKYELYYERAIILSATECYARVKLVDWGTEMVVPKEKVKEIRTPLFTTAPVSALHCVAVEDFEPWNNGLPQFLYKGYVFSITVKHAGKEFETPHVVCISQTKD